MKKRLTFPGEIKTIFELRKVTLSVNYFWIFFQIWDKLFPNNGSLTKTSMLDTFLAITLGVHNLLRNDLIHESINVGG